MVFSMMDSVKNYQIIKSSYKLSIEANVNYILYDLTNLTFHLLYTQQTADIIYGLYIIENFREFSYLTNDGNTVDPIALT